jgi:hypothetical protein
VFRTNPPKDLFHWASADDTYAMIRRLALAIAVIACACAVAGIAAGANVTPTKAVYSHWRRTVLSKHLTPWWKRYLGHKTQLSNCELEEEPTLSYYNCNVVLKVFPHNVEALAALTRIKGCEYDSQLKAVSGPRNAGRHIYRTFRECG